MFRFKSWFNRHISTHDPANFQCNYCPKVFKRKDTLREHISCHVGGRVFQCIECVKKFSNRRNLNAHKKMIHNSDPIKCPKCQNYYADKRQLRYHNLRKHTDEKNLWMQSFIFRAIDSFKTPIENGKILKPH